MSGLKFINLTRRFGRDHEDGSSLSLGGTMSTPGFVGVVGNLEHNVEIAPRTNADRLAMIAWLESPACKAITGANPARVPNAAHLEAVTLLTHREGLPGIDWPMLDAHRLRIANLTLSAKHKAKDGEALNGVTECLDWLTDLAVDAGLFSRKPAGKV